MNAWLAPETRRRRVIFGVLVYLMCTVGFFASASRARIVTHTPYNHYALLADCWLQGRLDLPGPPPPYAGGNDFALHNKRWFVSFPPFPAVWLLPWVAIAGEVENVRDGQAFLWLAGVGPAVLWLVLEKLRRSGKSGRSETTNFVLALLFTFGTVYWFTSIQGTVWFAAHVVAVALAAMFVLYAIDASHPVLAGTMLGLAWMTRPPMLMLALLFALEAIRMSMRDGFPARRGGVLQLLYDTWQRLDIKSLLGRWSLFLLPLLAILGVSLLHNYARFGDPLEFGHKLLTVAWRARIDKWGLFSFHYLARNLGVMLTSLPYLNHVPSGLQINVHGLALWLTTPLYLWLLWPRNKGWHYAIFAITAAAVAIPNLLYQNSGWMQFGFRFSNDFAILLFVMLAIGGRRFGGMFWGAAAFSVAVNAFGALTFDRPNYSKYYFVDGSQRTIYQPD